MKDEKVFIDYINDHYCELKNKYWKFCQEKQYTWDEDIFSDTILKCYDTIAKKGLKDKTAYGIESYFFKSFKNNTLLEPIYSRNKKRDYNINSDNINDIYENWYNENLDDARVKIVNDLWKDFATLYIMTRVEEHFDNEHFYLFRIKTLGNLTFKQLAEISKIKASRLKCIEVMRWIKENITKEEIKKVFYELYGSII